MRTALSEGIVDGNGGGLEASRKLTDFLDEAPVLIITIIFWKKKRGHLTDY